MSNMSVLNWSAYLHETSLSSYDGGQKTTSHTLNLNQDDGDRTEFCNRTPKAKDKSSKSLSKSG